MATDLPRCERWIGRIPVRNLWLLMLYASDLTRIDRDRYALVDKDIDDLPNLVARLLTDAVERRLRRNLTRGYHHREMILTRVRGRIDILTTEAGQLLSRGEVFCGFEELTIDTPRNRLVRAALDLLSRIVPQKEGLAHRCRALSATLARGGVGGRPPSRADLALDQIGRNDVADRFMIALARLAFDLALPTEESGPSALVAPDREEVWVRKLFEKAVLGFSRVELEPLGWSVRGSSRLRWQVNSPSAGLAAILPIMETDMVLDSPQGRRLIIDTKFASILTSARFGEVRLNSGYLYQMYAYLRSQEGIDPCWESAAGLFLHPAIHGDVREQVVIQDHQITFATVDLGSTAAAIRNELRKLLIDGFDVEIAPVLDGAAPGTIPR